MGRVTFKFYRDYVKRIQDIILSSIGLVLLSPLLAVIAVLVRIKLGSPILFTQDRPGKDEIIFKLYKFRTMTDKRNSSGELMPDKYRLTRFGRILRNTSLDELPELWNILKGDMSVVGPRPLLVQYLELYNRKQRARHKVRPGLTGLAQINGRNAISWEEKFELDFLYIKDISFINDWKIILKTFKKVLNREGISQDGHETMEFFQGSKKTKTDL